jgi:hypothetical protein
MIRRNYKVIKHMLSSGEAVDVCIERCPETSCIIGSHDCVVECPFFILIHESNKYVVCNPAVNIEFKK